MNGLTKSTQVYIGIFAITALIIFIFSIVNSIFNQVLIHGIIFFSILILFTEILKVPLPRGGFVTVTFAVAFTCVLLFGALVAAIATLVGYVLSEIISKEKSPWFKIIFNSSQYVISVFFTQFSYAIAGGVVGEVNINQIIPLLASAIGCFLINHIALTGVLALAQKMSPLRLFIANIKWTLPNMLTLSLLGIIMAGVYSHSGYWGISLFFIPLLLARYIFKSYMDISQNYFDTLAALAIALDAKDQYTRGHSERVAEYATLIAKTMKLRADQVEKIQHMALLHDVGKIGVSDEILCKPDKLTDSEFSLIQEHSALGAKIIETVKGLGENKEMVLYHHERFGGGGYPTGIAGNNIPIGARIITVADSFDAMTSDRSYRPRMTHAEAIEILKEMSGIQFDPLVVEAFIEGFKKVQKEAIQMEMEKEPEAVMSANK